MQFPVNSIHRSRHTLRLSLTPCIYLTSLSLRSLSCSLTILSLTSLLFLSSSFFFFNDPTTTEIYTLSLHDALPISLNLRKTLLMASSVRLKPLNCSRLPCVYAQETLTFLLTQKKTCVKNYVQKE